MEKKPLDYEAKAYLVTIWGDNVKIEIENEFHRKRKKSEKRGNISEFSIKSMKRAKWRIESAFEKEKFQYTFTLTLPFEVHDFIDGVYLKKVFNNFMTVLRQEYGSFPYVWVLEFQRNGNPHYHVACNQEFDYEYLSLIWGRVNQKLTRFLGEDVYLKHLSAGVYFEKIRSVSGCSHYFGNYLGKKGQKSVPVHFKNVGRFWCVSSKVEEFKVEIFSGKIKEVSRNLRNCRRLVKSRGCKSWLGKVFGSRSVRGGYIWSGLKSVEKLV